MEDNRYEGRKTWDVGCKTSRQRQLTSYVLRFTFLVLLLYLCLLLPTVTAHAWYNTNWLKRSKITIDATNVAGSSNLPSFPVLVNVVDDDLKSTLSGGDVEQTDGGDILFTSSDEVTKIDHEIESYDPTTGEIQIWVEVPVLDYDDDTILYIYYGNDAGGLDEQNAAGTWSAAFQGVWHLQEDPSSTTDTNCAGAGDEGCDSTANNYDWDSAGTMTSADTVVGKVANSIDFDGSDDVLDVGTMGTFGSAMDTTPSTYSIWVKSSNTTDDMQPMGTANDGSNTNLQFGINQDDQNAVNLGYISFYYRDEDNTKLSGYVASDTGVTDGNWHHDAWGHDFAKDTLRIYLDGVAQTMTYNLQETPNNSANFQYSLLLGALNNRGALFAPLQGTMDEVRIRNVPVNSEIILTEYLNQNAVNSTTTSWYSTTNGLSNWNYRKKITIDNTQVNGSSNLPDFPVLINTTDSQWASTANGGRVEQTDGGDIVFTQSDGTTQLDHEIESYDATTGELVAWVEVPALDHDDDTHLWMYYGNETGVADQWDITGTWSAAFLGVWHMSEDPSTTADGDCSGGTKEVCDSMSYNNDGDSNGSMTSADTVNGKIHKGIDFDGNDDYTQIPASANWTQSQISVFFWVNYNEWGASGTSNEWNSPLETYADNGNAHEFSFTSPTDSSNDLSVFMNNGTTSVTVKSNMNSEVGNWRYIGVTYDGAIVRSYYEGAEANTTSASFSVDASGGFRLGGGRSADDVQLDGIVDTVHIRDTAVSSDIIQTEYNNQNSPSTFYTIQPEEAGPFLALGAEEDPPAPAQAVHIYFE